MWDILPKLRENRPLKLITPPIIILSLIFINWLGSQDPTQTELKSDNHFGETNLLAAVKIQTTQNPPEFYIDLFSSISENDGHAWYLNPSYHDFGLSINVGGNDTNFHGELVIGLPFINEGEFAFPTWMQQTP